MSRERVSKGVIIPKKDEKVIDVLLTLKTDVSGDEFVKEFRKKHPEDWERVQKRFNEHERLTKAGKSHPMAHPHQYILNASRKIRELYRQGKNLNELLIELNTPKPKFLEGFSPELENILKSVTDFSSYETRIEAINKLGKWKCEESIQALNERMLGDPVFEVRDTAYQRLKRFGLEVVKPSKGKAYIDPDIQTKLAAVATELKPGFSQERFTKKFKLMYPAEFDLQQYHKKNQFIHWVKKIMDDLPKIKQVN